MISLLYFVACVLIAAATSTYASLLGSVIDVDGSTPMPRIVISEQSLLQRARRDSLNERVRRLRASSDDYVESARLLADRTDSLSQQTEQLLEERNQQSTDNRNKKTTATLRLRKTCSVDRCTSVCTSDCNFVCSNPNFDRPSECDIPQFCDSTCTKGCREESCKFAFDADSLASQMSAHASNY
jgi:hypothetical protein